MKIAPGLIFLMIFYTFLVAARQILSFFKHFSLTTVKYILVSNAV